MTHEERERMLADYNAWEASNRPDKGFGMAICNVIDAIMALARGEDPAPLLKHPYAQEVWDVLVVGEGRKAPTAENAKTFMEACGTEPVPLGMSIACLLANHFYNARKRLQHTQAHLDAALHGNGGQK